MSEAERAHYLETTKDSGNKRCVSSLGLVNTVSESN